MPELPDLQAFSVNLQKKLAGKTIAEVVAQTNKLNVPLADLNKTLRGQSLKRVFREGKELHLEFEKGDVLGLHLMLHGELFLVEVEEEIKFSVFELVFKDKQKLVMADFQRQATPTLNPEVNETPDALSPKINFDFLKALLQKKNALIKNILLDQHVIRGIGNAYADEILWEAKISPFSVGRYIPDEAIRQLLKAIRTVLEDAERQIVKAQPDIISGEIRDFLKIHRNKNTKAPTGAEIQVVKTGARKTYYTDEQVLYGEKSREIRKPAS
jgi:formamidopyrimidine-DNA glycosylase